MHDPALMANSWLTFPQAICNDGTRNDTPTICTFTLNLVISEYGVLLVSK